MDTQHKNNMHYTFIITPVYEDIYMKKQIMHRVTGTAVKMKGELTYYGMNFKKLKFIKYH